MLECICMSHSIIESPSHLKIVVGRHAKPLGRVEELMLEHNVQRSLVLRHDQSAVDRKPVEEAEGQEEEKENKFPHKTTQCRRSIG